MSTMNIPRKLACTALVAIVTLGVAGTAGAGNREQAKRIHDRLVGTPPSAACLDQLEAEMATSANAAALDAITDDGASDT